MHDLLDSLPDPGDGPSRLAQAEKMLRLRAERDRAGADVPYWALTERELDVLRLLPSRLSQREIAAELYVSFNTIRTHTRVIFRKLGVASRAEAVARARELGLLCAAGRRSRTASLTREAAHLDARRICFCECAPP